MFWPSAADVEYALKSFRTLPLKILEPSPREAEEETDDEFWENLYISTPAVKDTLFSDDSSSAGSSEDECREEDLDDDAEDEIFPLSSKKFRWMASKGTHGRLHLCDGDSLACLRTLKMPDGGVGLDAALATQKSWSPRCWAALGPAAKAWWSKAQCGEL